MEAEMKDETLDEFLDRIKDFPKAKKIALLEERIRRNNNTIKNYSEKIATKPGTNVISLLIYKCLTKGGKNDGNQA